MPSAPPVPVEGAGAPADSEDAAFDEFEQEFEAPQSTDTAKKVYDPLRGYNRFMYKFNDKFYFWIAKPVAKGYSFIMPKPARSAIARAFHNFHFPLRFANSLLQLKFKQCSVELGRFVVNSTVGIGGLFDPAGSKLKWRSRDEDFGQTLAHYGVGEGFPIVLPFLGPSNLRDMIGLVPDYYTNPLVYIEDEETVFWVGAGESFNRTSLDIGKYESLKKDALDPYTFIRDAYKQNRDQKIKE